MNICIICEGRTEKAFKATLVKFLESRISGRMPRLTFDLHDGPIPKAERLDRVVRQKLVSVKQPVDAVIALTDVYPEFTDAEDAKAKMIKWVGNEPRFYPHVAQHDFEAWLLPYWKEVINLAKRQAKPFGENPEEVNHNNPPARRLKQLFEAGGCRDSYNKPRDASRILRDVNLMVAIEACAELKAFVNTILTLCDPSSRIP